jgi:hypothetical protein
MPGIAFKDLGFSLRDRGDDAFLYAYRAVENARGAALVARSPRRRGSRERRRNDPRAL